MSKEYLFLSGRIAALSSKLLTTAQLDRMIGSNDAEAAFRVLTELQYADYFDAHIKPKDFARIIGTGLSETKTMIVDGTDNDETLYFVWGEFDLNNLKKALKDRVVHGKTTLGDFTEENGYSNLGTWSVAEITETIFGDKPAEVIDEQYLAVIKSAENLYAANQSFLDVELELDKAHFAVLAEIAKRNKSKFLQEYLGLLADVTNALTLARLIASKMVPTERYCLPFGQLSEADFAMIQTKEQLTHLVSRLGYFAVADALNAAPDEEFLLTFERAVAKHKEQFLTDASAGSLGEIQIPMVYFMRRVQNARAIKFVMYAKFYGIESDKIYKTLHHL